MASNLSVITHTGIPGKAAIEQLNLLEDSGVDPRRVAIGHLGNLDDSKVYVHRQICRRGAYVGFDRQGGGNVSWNSAHLSRDCTKAGSSAQRSESRSRTPSSTAITVEKSAPSKVPAGLV